MAWGCLHLQPPAGLGWTVGASCALGGQRVPLPGTRLGSPSAAPAIASPSQEHCGSPEVLEQIYRCNPILRYTSSPLYAPLLPFPYGNLDQSGEGQAGVLRPGVVGSMVGAMAGQGSAQGGWVGGCWALSGPGCRYGTWLLARGGPEEAPWLLTPIPSRPTAPGPRSYTTLRDEAVKLFNSLQQLELERDPVPLMQGVLQTCLDLPPLVDEIYCQLVKQTTEPPAPGGQGDLHYWQLLTCMSCTFLPSPPVLRFLRFHLDRQVLVEPPDASCGQGARRLPGLPSGQCHHDPPGIFHRTESRFPASEMAKYACFIREALGKTKGRECVPSLEEILVLMRRQEMICTVHCPGAPACSVAISSHTTAEEVRGCLQRQAGGSRHFGVRSRVGNVLWEMRRSCGSPS